MPEMDLEGDRETNHNHDGDRAEYLQRIFTSIFHRVYLSTCDDSTPHARCVLELNLESQVEDDVKM
ncbi:MAG: hypothetical protein AAFY15_06815, partial [Cyanobacteria bacterium J06648_11]